MRKYYVYMMSSKTNSVLYTGVTNNLERRVNEHKSKKTKSFTSRYNVTKLVYYEETSYIVSAIKREKEIKGWIRRKKNALVELINPAWDDLAEYLFP